MRSIRQPGHRSTHARVSRRSGASLGVSTLQGGSDRPVQRPQLAEGVPRGHHHVPGRVVADRSALPAPAQCGISPSRDRRRLHLLDSRIVPPGVMQSLSAGRLGPSLVRPGIACLFRAEGQRLGAWSASGSPHGNPG